MDRSLLHTQRDPLASLLLPGPVTSWSGALIPKGGELPAGTHIASRDQKLRLLPNPLGLLVPLTQQAKKGESVLAGE